MTCSDTKDQRYNRGMKKTTKDTDAQPARFAHLRRNMGKRYPSAPKATLRRMMRAWAEPVPETDTAPPSEDDDK